MSKPTIRELEAILSEERPQKIEILPNGEVRARLVEAPSSNLRVWLHDYVSMLMRLQDETIPESQYYALTEVIAEVRTYLDSNAVETKAECPYTSYGNRCSLYPTCACGTVKTSCVDLDFTSATGFPEEVP